MRKADPKTVGKLLRSPKWTALTTRWVIIGPIMVTLVPPAIGPYNSRTDIGVLTRWFPARVVNCGTVASREPGCPAVPPVPGVTGRRPDVTGSAVFLVVLAATNQSVSYTEHE